MKRTKDNITKTIHYLKVLKNNSGIFQPEIREAINESINIYEELLTFMGKGIEEKTIIDKEIQEYNLYHRPIK